MVVLTISLPLGHPFSNSLKGWRGRPLLPLRFLLLFFLAHSNCPHQCPLFVYLHFYKGHVTSIRPSDDNKKNDGRKLNNTYADRNKYLIYRLQTSAPDLHNMHVAYRGWSSPTFPLLKWNFKDPVNEGLLLVSYVRTNTGWKRKTTTLKYLTSKWES